MLRIIVFIVICALTFANGFPTFGDCPETPIIQDFDPSKVKKEHFILFF
jgi:hypothetical protein